MEEYESLQQQFSQLSDEQLSEIVSNNRYADLPRKIASDILQSREANQQAQQAMQDEQQLQEAKRSALLMNRLYDDIHQIAKDVSFMKSFLVFCIILAVIAALLQVLPDLLKM